MNVKISTGAVERGEREEGIDIARVPVRLAIGPDVHEGEAVVVRVIVRSLALRFTGLVEDASVYARTTVGFASTVFDPVDRLGGEFSKLVHDVMAAECIRVTNDAARMS